jgi:hypothetical protein
MFLTATFVRVVPPVEIHTTTAGRDFFNLKTLGFTARCGITALSMAIQYYGATHPTLPAERDSEWCVSVWHAGPQGLKKTIFSTDWIDPARC